jgi:hypothetical protein
MKVKEFFVILSMVLIGGITQAQDEAITDEDLKKYAVTMDSVQSMTDQLIETISELVKSNEDVSAARYNELYKIIDDTTKLTEANATEVEIAFVNQVLARKDEETAKINLAFQSLAKDYVGAKNYNAIKKALKADAELKQKYDSMLAELQADDIPEKEKGTN